MSNTVGSKKPRKPEADQTDADKKQYQREDDDVKGAGLMAGLSSGAITTLDSTQQIALAGYQASVSAATQAALAAIGQQAAIAAAALKLSNDLNDASVSFMKNIGSSVKSAAQ
jgi:hypothetical protein